MAKRRGLGRGGWPWVATHGAEPVHLPRRARPQPKKSGGIRCVRLKPYENGNETIIDAQQVVPLLEAEDYIIRIKAKEQAARVEANDRHSLRREFWTEFLPQAVQATPRFAGRSPTDRHYVTVSAGPSGLSYVYCVWLNVAGVEFYVDRDDGSGAFNKAVFDHLYSKRAEIDAAYRGKLTWERLDDKRACRLYDDSVPVGIRSPREQWPTAQKGMIDAMTGLERVLSHHLAAAVAIAERKA